MNNSNTENALDLSIDVDDQFLKDNLNTMEKMHQLRTQLELKKRDKGSKLFNKTGSKSIDETDGKGLFTVNPIPFNCRDDANAMTGEEGAVGGVEIKCEASTSKTPRKYSRRIYLPPLKGFIENATSLKKNCRSDGECMALTDSSSKHQAQAQSPTTKLIPNDGNGTTSVVRSDETIWPAKVINETPKSKRKLTKSNWIQNLIEIVKTSKVPLSPGELNEIKESFESIRESIGKDTPSSPQTDKSCDLKQSPFESILSNFNKATTISSESYRSKIRDNIRRNRSFKAVGTNDLVIEENRVSFDMVFSFSLENKFFHFCFFFLSQRSKYPLNAMGKSKNGHHFNSNRSIDDLPETSTSNRSGSLSSLRSCGSSTGAPASSMIDLKYPIESDNNHRLYSRRIAPAKLTSNGFENKLYFEKQNASLQVGSSRCDERKSFSNDFHKFKSNSNPTSFGPSTAKAIADSSSFRVYKMAADGMT